MVQIFSVSVIINILMLVIYSTNGFNFSPKPNLIFKEPPMETFIKPIRSSYFGYTINLRNSSIIIGAPRSQSTIKAQRNINETGIVYKCHLPGTCKPYKIDHHGNSYAQFNGKSWESEIKDNQWLGASIDGGSKDMDNLVVCAPRLRGNFTSDYFLHGICYWTPNTFFDHPQNVKKITPLRLDVNQVKSTRIKNYEIRDFNHMLGEQGISVHITDDNEEILIGAPGIYNWKGSVIRYRIKSQQSVVPKPELWNKAHNTLFGYSVTSGNFDPSQPKKIFYVATAPQANMQSGEAYIFDILPFMRDPSKGYTIKTYFTFRGTQFGEYYGYAALAEDVNGDGLTDLIITAPQYSPVDIVDQGAIYVYINKRRSVFKLQKKIISPINGRGRFGSTIAKLGDINRDGFNDIAIGAPFADNGVVFIYLGSAKGLRELPSQKLTALPEHTPWGQHMFGHGLSKGCDFDKNGFNDFAIGAPNSESVYVYRAYPVVKILATINSLSREIKLNQNKFQIKICYMISTSSSKIQYHDITLKINVDPQIERVTLQQSNSGKMILNVTALIERRCTQLDATVRFSAAYIYKPIELEMQYELVHGVPDSEEFCDKCAAVDPAEPKISAEKIIFSTGCEADICIADLIVTSSGLTPSCILGSSTTINVTYEVSNTGETAYLPQINITSSIPIPYAKIPSSCKELENALLCDLNRGQLMAVGSRNNITIVYDVSQIEGTSITLNATVLSTGKERNAANNFVTDTIVLKEFTEIEALGNPLTADIHLKKIFGTAEITNSYEIKSNGPSRVQELEIAFEIPIAYKFHESSVPVLIIDINNITVEGIYEQQLLAVEFNQTQTLPMTNLKEMHTTDTPQFILMDLDTKSENPHLAGLANEYAKMVQEESLDLLSEDLVGTLPINRTITFSCTNSKRANCVRAVLKVYNFLPDMPVTINLTYNVDLEKVDNILIEPWEFFVIIPKLDIVKVGDEDGNTTHITKKINYHVISKQQLYSTPLWVIILSALGGLIVLGAIVYGMRKAGFFRRKTKENMDRLIQQHKRATQEAIAKFIEEQKAMDFENTNEPDYAEIPDHPED